MKKLFYLFFILLALFLNAQKVKNPDIKGKVINITDGDTVVILDQNKNQYKIRLWGIDAPEKKQEFGTKSKQFLARFIFGKNVLIKVKNKDRYKRILGIIFCNNQNINFIMVKYGFAWKYKHTKFKELDKLQSEAKQKKLGLWKNINPINPIDFRKKKKKIK